jgi:hypothetical protein
VRAQAGVQPVEDGLAVARKNEREDKRDREAGATFIYRIETPYFQWPRMRTPKIRLGWQTRRAKIRPYSVEN